MKKYLTLICVLLTLTAFASCGDSSSDNSESPESSISETTTEEETEPETSAEKDDFITVPDLYGMDYDEAVEKYKDSFAILSSGREESELKKKSIISQDIEAGTIYKSDGNRPRIYVKLSKSKKSNAVNEKTTKADKINKINVKEKIGDISFKIPDGYEKENNASDKTTEAVTYTYDNLDMINIAKQPGASQFDWDTMDEETKKLAFQTVVTSALSTYFDTVGDLEIITINGTFAVKQNAVYSGTDLPLTAYAFVYGDNLYTLMFTNMLDTQQKVIDSIQFSNIEQPESTKNETTTEKTTEKVTEKVTEKATEPPEPANVGNNEALKSAKSYINMSGFSYESLISQLEYEGFTHDEAVAAADDCGADWNTEALESAKSYIEMSGFSYTSLVSQLEYEKFTHEQAVYGADNCGADWNQQAADAARDYLDTMSMSREELLNQLLYEGFTQEQAEFGLQSVGY